MQRIDRDRIEGIMQAKQHRAAGTVNHHLATIRTILRKAEQEWGWIERAPVIRMREEPRQRVRWTTQEEAERLFATLARASCHGHQHRSRPEAHWVNTRSGSYEATLRRDHVPKGTFITS